MATLIALSGLILNPLAYGSSADFLTQVRSELESLSGLKQPTSVVKLKRAKLHFLLGREEKSLTTLQAGERLCEELLAAESGDSSTRARAALWWTANRGAQAELVGPLQALKIVNAIEERLKSVRAEAPDLESAGADRALGYLYEVVPRLISIGSDQKAETYLRSALERFPEHPGNLALLADVYFRHGKKKEARELALKVFQVKVAKDDEGEFRDWSKKARAILDATPEGGFQ